MSTFQRLVYRASQLFLITSLVLCTALPALGGDSGSQFADAIETAHNGEVWAQQQAIEAHIVVEFGGNTMIEGTLLSDTVGGKVRIELDNGTTFLFDGQDAWTSPADSEVQGGRFHVLTWSYFLLAPFKLQDEGSQLQNMDKMPLDAERQLPAAKLTFGSGVGDSPDDWYIVYRDTDHRLAGMAYIVTFGKDAAAAEKEPHAITYHQPVDVDGAAVASHWKFWNWTAEKGIHGEPIGQVKLSDIRFVQPADDAFVRPEDSRPELAPAP